MGIIVPRLTDLSDERQVHALQQFLVDLRNMAFQVTLLDGDGGVSGGRKAKNLDAVWVAYVSNATPDTEDTVAHNLGRVPQGALVGIPDVSATIYDGTTAWNRTNIFLRASAATVTVSLLVF